MGQVSRTARCFDWLTGTSNGKRFCGVKACEYQQDLHGSHRVVIICGRAAHRDLRRLLHTDGSFDTAPRTRAGR